MKKLFTLFLLAGSFFTANAQTGTVAITPATTVCTGSNITLTASGYAAPTITKWQFSPDNATWTDIAASAAATFIINNVAVTRYYRAIATSGLTPTNSALLTVDAPSSGTITTSANACNGVNSGTLTLSGTFTSVNYWEKSTDGGSTWSNIVNTTTSQSYTNLTQTTIYRASVTNNTCAAANAVTATITVNPTSVGGTTAGAATVCAGSNSGTLTLSGYTGTIQWQNSVNSGVTWANVAGQTANTTNYSNLAATTDYRAVVTSGVCSAANSTSVTITVTPASVGGATAGIATVCTGANSGNVTLSGQTGNVIRWELSTDGGSTWSTIVNTTTTQNYSNLTTTTLYRAVVQSGGCASANSTATTITVSPATVAGTVASAATVCAGSNGATLTLSGNTGTIQWQNSVNSGVTWANIAGQTANTTNYSNLAVTTDYRAVVTSGACAPANSTSVTITVDPTSAGGATAGAATVCTGSNSGSVTLSAQTGNVIRWELSTDGGTTWSTIVNTTTTQNYSNLTTTTLYRAVVQSGGCASANSAATTITVSPATVAGTVASSTSVCAGTNSGTLTLSGNTGTIVWQQSVNSGVSWANVAPANTTNTLNYSNLAATTDYRCVVTSGACAAVNSTSVTITVNPASAGGTTAAAATVCTGSNSGTVTLSAQTGNVIRWEYSTDGGSTWTTIVNTTTSQSYSNLTATTMYRAVVQSGGCASANSTATTITVSPATVGGSVSSSASVCAGSNSGTLTLSGHTGSVVRWETSTNGGVSWTVVANTTTILNYSNITLTTQYRAVIQSGSCALVNSADATVTVSPVSVGGNVTTAATVCSGSNNGTLQLNAYTGNVIRWEYSTDGGSTWTIIANTVDTYTYNNLTATTLFRAVVQSGGCASANSANVTITVSPATAGGTVSSSASACAGSNSGTLTLSGHTGSIVRWEFSTNGGVSWTTIANTTTIYNYSNITQTTDYRAVVQSGTCPSANSVSATITINPISVGGTVTANATVCSGVNNGTLFLTGYTGNVIRWEQSIDNGVTWTTIANTTDNYTYNNITVTTKYRAVVQSGGCTAANSIAATITISPASVGGTVAGSASACSGSNSGTLTLSGHTGSIIRWEFSIDGGVSWTVVAPNNTTTFLNYSNLTATTDYRAIVQSGTCPTANSSVGTVTIFPISVGGTANASAIVCSGMNGGILQLTGYTGNIVRWEYSIDNGTTWNTIANTTDTLSYANLTVKTLYRAFVQSGACTAKYSTTATITINAASVGGATAGAATYCSGTNNGTLTLSGYVGSITKWQTSIDGGVTWVTTNPNVTTAFYNYSNLTQTTDFRAVLQNGSCPAANSSVTTITIYPISVGGTVNSSATVCGGSNNGTLLLTAYTGNVVRWEYSIDNGTTWNNIANSTDTLSYNNLSVKTLYRALVQSGTCSSKYSTNATITVNAPSVGGIVSADDTVCSGNNGAVLQLSGYVGTIQRWQSSIDGGVTWVTIVNTSAVYSYSNITATTLFRAVIQNGACQSVNSAYATITVFPLSVGGTLNSSATVCSASNNGTLQLTAYTGSVTHWEYSTDNGLTWNNVANNTDTLSYNNLTIKTLYRASVQSGFCASKYSTIATITVNAPSAGGIVSGTDTVCSGSNSGNLTLSGYVGSIVRWQSSTDGGVTWANIANTTALYNYVNINTTTNYRAVVQNGGCAADNSSQAIITVFPLSVGGTVAPANYAACSGINSGTIVLSGQAGNVLYWESSIDGGVTWISIANTASTQNFQNLTVTTMFRAMVQNGFCTAAHSTTSTINVFPASVGGLASKNDTVCTGSNSGSVVLSGFTGSILNWEFSIDGGVTWTSITNTTAIQNYTNLTVTTMYRAVVQSGSCSTANSSAATITVSPATVGGSVLSSTFVCDSTTSGTLTLSGYTGTVLSWEKSTDGGVTWTTISDTTNTYTYSGITKATMFRSEVQSPKCNVMASAAATISLAIPANANFSVNINGATVIFTNTSTSNNGTSFWNFGDNTTSTITAPAHTYTANGSYLVTLIISDSCGSDTATTTVLIMGIGIHEYAYNNPDVIIYPNPFNDNATILIANRTNENYEFKLFDMYGKEIRKEFINNSDKYIITRGDLAAGVYFYKLVTSDETIATGKLVIQ